MSHTHEPAKNPARAAVVTGATSGIGRATALELARRGWRVYAVGRRAERLETLAADARAEGVSGDVVPAALDVTDEAAVAALASRVEADGGADTLVNIAGGALGTDAVGVGDRADWEWMYRVNVLGTLTMCQAFLPMLRAHGAGTLGWMQTWEGNQVWVSPSGEAGVAYWAHAGGFAAGLVLTLPLFFRRGGTAFWAVTRGRPPHLPLDYAPTRIPQVRR